MTNPSAEEIADHRIAVTKTTWERLSYMKEPGETFDQLIERVLNLNDINRMSMNEMDESSES